MGANISPVGGAWQTHEVADYNGHMVTDAITLMTFIFSTGSPAGLFLLFGF